MASRTRSETDSAFLEVFDVRDISRTFFIFEVKPPDAPTAEDEEIEERLLFYHPTRDGMQEKQRRLFMFGASEAFVDFSRVLVSQSPVGTELVEDEPKILRLDNAVLAIEQCDKYVMVISGHLSVPDELMKQRMRSLQRAIAFYNGPLPSFFNRMEQRCGVNVAASRHEVTRMATEVSPLLVETVQHESPLSAIDPIHYTMIGTSSFVFAEQMLDTITSDEDNFCASLFFDRSVICSQVESTEIIRWIGNRIRLFNRRHSRRARTWFYEEDEEAVTPPDSPMHEHPHGRGTEVSADTRWTTSVVHSSQERTDYCPVWIDNYVWQRMTQEHARRLQHHTNGPGGQDSSSDGGSTGRYSPPCGSFSSGGMTPSSGVTPLHQAFGHSPPTPTGTPMGGAATPSGRPGGFPDRLPPAAGEGEAIPGLADSSSLPSLTHAKSPGPRLPEFLTEVTEEGRFVGLCVHTLSHISIAVLMSIHTLYDDRHVGKLLSQRIQRTKILELERRVLHYTNKLNTEMSRPKAASFDGDPKETASENYEVDGSDGKSSSSGEPHSSHRAPTSHRGDDQQDFTDWAKLSPMHGVPASNLPYSVLQYDDLDGRAQSCGKLSRLFLEACLYARSVFNNAVVHSNRLCLISSNGLVIYARRVRSCYIQFYLKRPPKGLEKVECVTRDIFERDYGRLLF